MGENSVRTGIFGIEWIGSNGVNVVLSGPQVQPAPEKTHPRKKSSAQGWGAQNRS